MSLWFRRGGDDAAPCPRVAQAVTHTWIRAMIRLLVVSVALCLVACGGDDPPSTTPDGDGDGIYAPHDQCPFAPETFNGYQDADGCPDTPPPPPEVDSGFTGVWRGPVTITAPGQNPVVNNGSISLVASGRNLTATAFCPDGSGALSMTGSGRSLTWSGSYSCSYASSACANTTLTYNTAAFTLNNASSMSLSATGVLAGCGQSFNVTVTMNGGR